ncbi:MAG: Exported protein [Nitrospira sp.]|nr:Exported protein [Nitrospira sp.]
MRLSTWFSLLLGTMLASPASLTDEMPTYRSAPATPHHEDMAAYGDSGRRAVTGELRYVPDWARDWHASVASTGAVQAEVCGLYGEWLNLNQKSRGGFYFGSDPSYGGDLSGQNQRGASFSFYDNARYLSLAKVFGAGFVPIGCL